MKDFGLDFGLVQEFNTSSKYTKGAFYGFRKMFWKYLAKMNVPFADPCCSAAGATDSLPVRFNPTKGNLEYNAGAGWIVADTAQKNVLSAINATATATATQIAGGAITSTSAAATTITLPTATLLATELGASRGTEHTFFVDNSGGANVVTVAVGTGITAITAVVTGSATLTVAAGATALFRLYFTSGTTAVISRVY